MLFGWFDELAMNMGHHFETEMCPNIFTYNNGNGVRVKRWQQQQPNGVKNRHRHECLKTLLDSVSVSKFWLWFNDDWPICGSVNWLIMLAFIVYASFTEENGIDVVSSSWDAFVWGLWRHRFENISSNFTCK